MHSVIHSSSTPTCGFFNFVVHRKLTAMLTKALIKSITFTQWNAHLHPVRGRYSEAPFQDCVILLGTREGTKLFDFFNFCVF